MDKEQKIHVQTIKKQSCLRINKGKYNKTSSSSHMPENNSAKFVRGQSLYKYYIYCAEVACLYIPKVFVEISD
jgi:hypothetical protein